MSVQALGWVFDHSPTKGSDRLVLLSIANHAGDDVWEAWPSVETMRREAGIDRLRTVQDALTRLEAGGHLTRVVNGSPDERVPKNRRSSLYRIQVAAGVECGRPRCAQCGVTASDTPTDARGVALRRDGVSVSDGLGCRKTTPKPSVKPSVEPSVEKHAEADAPAALFETPKPKPKGKKSAKPLTGQALVADELARAEWERRPIKPVCGFVPLRLRIGEALEAGHTREAIAAVLPTMPVFSRNSFDLALSSRSAKRTPRPVDDDRARPSGKVTL